MKKSWKKLWESQLDEVVPALRGDIRDLPVQTAERPVPDGKTAVKVKKPVIISVLAAFIAAVIAVTIILVVIPRGNGRFAFTLEINPAVTFITDGNGKVEKVASSNRDADIILSDNETASAMTGKSLAEAVAVYTDRAAMLGYLDLGRDTAVRLSSLGNGEKMLNSAQSSLEDYFAEKGFRALVVSETVDAQSFSVRCGFDLTSAESLAESISGKMSLYSERLASSEGLKSVYENEILTDSIAEAVGEYLDGNFDRIEKNIRAVSEIYSLYFEIYGHKDNPALLLKGYWDVKKYYGDSLTGEFAELVKEMDNALAEYERDYGVKIESELQFKDLSETLLTLSVEQLKIMLEDFTSEMLRKNLALINGVLGALGANTKITEVLTVPESAEQFIEKAAELSRMEYGYRLRKNEEVYNAERESFSRSGYADYKESIISRYGSLSEYWEKLK